MQPDRRGLAPGARWQVTGENKPTILRRPEAVGYLIVVAVEPRQRIAFQLTGDRLEVELTLEPAARRRTKASLKVEGPWLVGLSRALPRHALHRLYSLVQTGAT